MLSDTERSSNAADLPLSSLDGTEERSLWTSSDYKPAVPITEIGCHKLEQELADEVQAWQGDLSSFLQVILKVVSLARDAPGGCLVLVATRSCLRRQNFKHYCSHTDEG